MARAYKIFRKCKGCNKKFLVKHKLRLYCDDCRQKTEDKKKKRVIKRLLKNQPRKKRRNEFYY